MDLYLSFWWSTYSPVCIQRSQALYYVYTKIMLNISLSRSTYQSIYSLIMYSLNNMLPSPIYVWGNALSLATIWWYGSKSDILQTIRIPFFLEWISMRKQTIQGQFFSFHMAWEWSYPASWLESFFGVAQPWRIPSPCRIGSGHGHQAHTVVVASFIITGKWEAIFVGKHAANS